MTGFWVLDYLCLAGILACAALVVFLRNRSGSVMALSGVGTLMGVLFVVLGAPDVAHAEVIVGMVGLPRELASLPAIAQHAMRIALPVWGTTEAVSEIVYGSRGFDTFGETFLLPAAVIAVTVLARGREPRAEYVGEEVAG